MIMLVRLQSIRLFRNFLSQEPMTTIGGRKKAPGRSFKRQDASSLYLYLSVFCLQSRSQGWLLVCFVGEPSSPHRITGVAGMKGRM